MLLAMNRPINLLRSAAVMAIVMAVAILAGTGLSLSGLLLFHLSLWAAVLLVAAAGAFLIIRAHRPLAGTGALLAAAAAIIPFSWQTPPSGTIWTLALFAGIGLIAAGTRADTTRPGAWPLILVRVAVGWAFLDNGAADWMGVGKGGNFLNAATAAVKRAPLDFIDPMYHHFLKFTIIPHWSPWAGLFYGGETAFGLLLAVGLFSSLAAWGTIWLSANIIIEKSFTTHGTYVDKTYLLGELFCLITSAGLVFGLDAALAPHAPPLIAGVFMGAPARKSEGELVPAPGVRAPLPKSST